MKLTEWLAAVLRDAASILLTEEDERSLSDGSRMIGDMNFRTGEMDCGLDPGGFYEDDL